MWFGRRAAHWSCRAEYDCCPTVPALFKVLALQTSNTRTQSAANVNARAVPAARAFVGSRGVRPAMGWPVTARTASQHALTRARRGWRFERTPNWLSMSSKFATPAASRASWIGRKASGTATGPAFVNLVHSHEAHDFAPPKNTHARGRCDRYVEPEIQKTCHVHARLLGVLELPDLPPAARAHRIPR